MCPISSEIGWFTHSFDRVLRNFWLILAQFLNSVNLQWIRPILGVILASLVQLCSIFSTDFTSYSLIQILADSPIFDLVLNFWSTQPIWIFLSI